jgi:hypothetical protein
VIAKAGMPNRAASRTSGRMRAAPSSIEYSVWTCKWVKLFPVMGKQGLGSASAES